MNRIYQFFLLLIGGLILSGGLFAQSRVLAQLAGSPVDTAGWTFYGAAKIGNLVGSDNSEIIVCPKNKYSVGGVFFNRPLQFGNCKKWKIEFEFRIFDGNGADGMSFCFLDKLPTTLPVGGELGIPLNKGLKVVFDTYRNCKISPPAIELRWGVGYSECWDQPTIDNQDGNLSFLRSSIYHRAQISYDNGEISVYINGKFFLKGYQQLDFDGYIGFTGTTGELTDNHSIRNVKVYADYPPKLTLPQVSICSNEIIPLISASQNQTFTVFPETVLINPNAETPSIKIPNLSDSLLSQKLFLRSAYKDAPDCFAVDSTVIRVKPQPQLRIEVADSTKCSGSPLTFSAHLNRYIGTPLFQWTKNGVAIASGQSITVSGLNEGDTVRCLVSGIECADYLAIPFRVVRFLPAFSPLLALKATATVICPGTGVTFTAVVSGAGAQPVYQWRKNGAPVGSNASTYSDASLQEGDSVWYEIRSTEPCAPAAPFAATGIRVRVEPFLQPTLTVKATATVICPGTGVTFTAVVSGAGAQPVYQWKKNGAPVGSNASTYSDASLQEGDSVWYEIRSTEPCAPAAPFAATGIRVRVEPFLQPTLTVKATATVICPGTGVTFTAVVSGAGAQPVYQWRKNGAPVGSNASTYSDASLQEGDSVWYEIRSTEPCAPAAPFAATGIRVRVEPFLQPTLTVKATATVICPGTGVTFTAVVSGAGAQPVYQWRKNGAPVGSNASTYSDASLQEGDSVWYEIRSTEPCAPAAPFAATGIRVRVEPFLQPTLTVKATATVICPGTGVTFTAVVSGVGAQPVYQWKKNGAPVGSNAPTYSDASLRDGDSVWCELTIREACTAVAFLRSTPLHLTVHQKGPIPIDLGKDTVICQGPWELNAGAGYQSYVWQDGSTGPVYRVTKTGLYRVTVTDQCHNKTSAAIQVTVERPPVFSFSPQQTLCAGDTVKAEAPPGFASYRWAIPGTPFEIRTPRLETVPTNGNTYVLTVTTGSGCRYSDSLVVQLHPPASVVLPNDTTLCEGNTFLVKPDRSFSTYQWSTGSVASAITLSQAGTYWLKAGDANGCWGSDTVQLRPFFPLPKPVLSRDSLLCAGENKVLDAGVGYPSYTWSTGEKGQRIAVDKTGSYWVRVIDRNGCQGSDTARLTRMLPNPQPLGVRDTAVCLLEPFVLQANGPFVSYQWSTGEQTPSIRVRQAGFYSVQVRDGWGCTGQSTIQVQDKGCQPGLFVPTAFTPNGDGKNDVLKPHFRGEVVHLQFVVYNRWGGIVFQTREQNGGWKGPGVGVGETTAFTWVCTYQFSGLPVQTAKGTVLLLR